MMKNIVKIGLILLGFSMFTWSCQHSNSGPDKDDAGTVQADGDFADYWYQGKAELSSYTLSQSRYGEIHPGHAVLVFVTEDFSKKRQVKLDNPGSVGKDKVPILKLNFTKKFNTGVYPYSMMQSVFSPVDQKTYPYALKTTVSSQEWCGHTFAQLNRKEGKYALQSFSYFGSEGDISKELPGALLEDELWNLIRINPKGLPTGSQKVIPAIFHSRLKHVPLKAQDAKISLEEKGEVQVYTISYPKLDRVISIRFEKKFPHKIMGWEETYKGGFGAGSKQLTTKAVLNKSILSDYWSRHNLADAGLRTALGLP